MQWCVRQMCIHSAARHSSYSQHDAARHASNGSQNEGVHRLKVVGRGAKKGRVEPPRTPAVARRQRQLAGSHAATACQRPPTWPTASTTPPHRPRTSRRGCTTAAARQRRVRMR
eukprot:37897-Chlamydomonas_euryale.AAC.20